ncbi:UNVERIFIED_CONTAM: Pentatricopeptide repeat-containing protein, mitochondrial [Sesamum latifolium]|uniref:Pentatricopeptide repeat-containing protein, mitochondrial n=1 Tax=Sesamum latifolium TaxID=2727402 RepID=A0AAW2TJL6_9LAMI
MFKLAMGASNSRLCIRGELRLAIIQMQVPSMLYSEPSKLSPFHVHTLSLLPKRNKPKKHYDVTATVSTWNTTHRFVLANPTLSILETKCKSMVHLKQVQSQMIVTGLCLDGLAYSRLIAFSALSPMGDLNYSKRLFFAMQNPNAFSWNTVIRASCDSQKPSEAFLLYKEMLAVVSVSGVSLRPDNYTFPLLFKTCAKLLFFQMGHEILGHESCVRDLVSWNFLINGYTRSGRGKEALRIYREMEMEGDVDPDEVTMIVVVTACTQLEDLKLGREFHWCIRDRGLNMTVPLANALVDMYVKCGDLEEAKKLFERMEEKTMVSWTTMVIGYAKFGYLDAARRLFNVMPEKDVVPWNAMISAYVQAGRGKEALSLFHEMQAMKVEPDEVTMEIPGRNALTYTAIIGGLALHGDAQDALSYFLEMIDAGLTPDEVTFLGVLSACCHGGLVEEGRKIFSQMSSKFNIPPKIKHYCCMVDLLGRAGLLKEAVELLESMPMEADAVVWGAVFFACRIHKNIELGERSAMKLIDLDPDDSGIYVLLANMYVEANMWDKAGEVRKMMRERGVDKTPSCSSIEVNGNLYEFIVRDKSHSQSNQIYECLIQLSKQMELVECVAGVPHPKDEFLFACEVNN